ncbi:beta-galactosidase [Dictyobacter sp. S3.2.2.5]|uniref:Beta-galactosidase n=1 Tax=Dictyobacter halimunensis TaxID=3026934 RepID=A0ABQ6FRT0_9CHLR|nr:beta-galactosidase [Dictyobacter sp. S3.2.2.5]
MQHPLPGHILYGGDYNPEQWSEDVWLEDMRLMKLANVNMVSINIFSWALLEPKPEHYHFEQLDRIMDLLHEHGISADLATATASPPTWMSRLYPSMLPVTREGVRMSHGSRQHYCPNSPDFRRKSAALVQRLAERYAQHPALEMWHLNNEYGCHTSQCYCDNCAEAFRVWLQDRYNSLEELNTVWGTNFWSQRYYEWEDVLPPRISPAQNNPGQTLDYWRFMNDSLLGCYRIEEDILRAVTPNVPLTTNLMVAFKPVDAYDWARHMDIVSFDMYPAPGTDPAWNALHHDLMRSAKGGRPHMVMEQSPSQVNWQPQNPHKRPGQMRLHSLQGVAHGADGILFFQWRQSKTGAEMFHSAVVTHEGDEHNRIFKQAAQVGAELAMLSESVAGTSTQSDVAILMDWDNWWAVEYLPGPSHRLKYMEIVGRYYHAFHQQNISIDIVKPDSDLSKYKVVAAPLLYMLRPGVADNLEAFVSKGGTLLTSFFSGIVDENNHVALGGYPGMLRKLLGIHVEEFDPLTPAMHNQVVIKEGALAGSYPAEMWGELVHLEGAQALGTFAEDYYADQPALTVNHFGNGNVYYLATQSSQQFLDSLAQEICQQAGVQPLLSLGSEIEVTRRITTSGASIYFLLNHQQQDQQVTLPDGTYTSLLDGATVKDQLTIPAMEVAILQAR